MKEGKNFWLKWPSTKPKQASRFLITLLFLILTTYVSFGQERVRGTIKDADDFPLIGASVVIKGTSTGTVTDINGNFSLEAASKGDTLVISYVGYKSQQTIYRGQTSLNITLDYDESSLEEVVVTGYGTQRKKDLTGSIVSVDAQRFQDIPANNLTSALQGSVPGLSINTASGAPGSGSNILIRGVQSLLASNSPLVVIDGMLGGSINDIHPNDIEDIQVLKDASATSIYGSRASNGVIIITTKRGKSGKPRVSYSGYYGFSKLANEVDVLSADEYVAKKREIFRMKRSRIPAGGEPDFMSLEDAQAEPIENILNGNELEMYNLGKSYDWLEEVTRPAPIHNHNLSVSGGTAKTKYFLSASIIDQTGAVYNSDYARQSIRANISTWVTSWLQVGTNLLANRTTQNNVPGAIFRYTYQLSPLGKKYMDEENPGDYELYPLKPDEFIANPFTEIAIEDKRTNLGLLNSTFIEISPITGLSYTLKLNTVLDYFKTNTFVPLNTRQVRAFDNFENASIRYEDRLNLNLQNILSYTNMFGQHRVTGTFVYTTEEYRRDDLWAYGQNFGSDYYKWTALELGQVDSRDYDSNEERSFLESYIGRLNYNFADKYLLQLTLRNDRSSRFSKENRNALFPGVSAGWVLSDEPFLQSLPILDRLKLRVSWAKTGNQAVGYRDRYNVGDKVYYTTGNDGGGQIVEGLVQTSLANKDLRWEIAEEWNFGLDFQLLQNRLSGVVEVYNRVTSDLLWNQSISSVTGFTSIRNNIGSLQNRGLETSLNGLIVSKRDFNISATATFTTNQNKILDLDGTKTDDIPERLFIGEPVGVIYDHVFDGVLQEGETPPAHMPYLLPGEVKVKNTGSYEELEDGTQIRSGVPDSVINEADQQIIGQSQPKWFASFGVNASYKNFDLSIFINHVQGLTRRIPIDVNTRPHSMDIPYYTNENPSKQYGRPEFPNTPGRIANQFDYLSYYVDASYTRLQNITLGYNMSNSFLESIEIDKIRFYVTGQNLFTITDYLGYDPAPSYSGNQTNANVDQLTGYPTIKNIIFGLNITF